MSRQEGGEKAFCKKVERRGQHTARVLQHTVGIIYLGRDHADTRIILQIAEKRRDDIPIPPYVGIHYEMKAVRVGQGIPDGEIMTLPESTVLNVHVFHAAICPGHSSKRIVRTVVYDVNSFHFRAQQALQCRRQLPGGSEMGHYRSCNNHNLTDLRNAI